MPNHLHVGIQKLLVRCGLHKGSSRVTYISSYIDGEPYIGILKAVKFRLFNPGIPIVFFSFHSRGQLSSKDTFGILALTGTEYVRLPCTKEKLLQADKKYEDGSLHIDQTRWQHFSRKACKALLKKRLAELKHGNKLDLGNKVLNPLRIACVNMRGLRAEDAVNQSVLQDKLSSLEKYMAEPELAELLAVVEVYEGTDDKFLKTMKAFANQLIALNNWGENADDENIDQLISTIDGLNNTFEQVKNY